MFEIQFKWNQLGGCVDNINHRTWKATRREAIMLLLDPAYTLVKVVKK